MKSLLSMLVVTFLINFPISTSNLNTVDSSAKRYCTLVKAKGTRIEYIKSYDTCKECEDARAEKSDKRNYGCQKTSTKY